MNNEINLQKNNNNRDWTDVEWMQEFHEFLQGKIPEGMICTPLNLTPEQSSLIIWYLQEHLPVFPDNIYMCDECKDMYDSYSEGCYYDIERKHYCGGCEDNSEAAYCYDCMDNVWKKDARMDDDEDMYYCEKCKIEQQKMTQQKMTQIEKINEILNAVTNHFGISIQELQDNSREQNLVFARMITAHEMNRIGLTQYEIGHKLFKTHGTIWYYIHKYKDNCEFIPVFKIAAEEIEKNINEKE